MGWGLRLGSGCRGGVRGFEGRGGTLALVVVDYVS